MSIVLRKVINLILYFYKVNDIVIQYFDDWQDDSFKERIYTNEDFRNDPQLFYKLMVEWLNTLSDDDKFRFNELYGNILTLETCMEDGCFVYHEETIFDGVVYKNVTSNERMPNGSFIKERKFLIKQ